MSSVAQLEAEIATGRGVSFRKSPSCFISKYDSAFFNITGQAELVTPEIFISLGF